MEYIYAAMLLHKAKKELTEAAIDKVLSAAGVAVDKARVKATIVALNGVDIDKVIKEASVAAPAAAVAAPAHGGASQKKEEKKEDKKTEEEAAAGLGALFG